MREEVGSYRDLDSLSGLEYRFGVELELVERLKKQ